MKLHVLFKLILAIPWLGLMAPSLAAAEPVTHRDYYSIQVLTGTPAAMRDAWQKVQDLPFARIEKHVGQHRLRIGYWSSKEEAENQLAGMKKHFPGAFVFATEYKPGEILLGWSEDAAKSPGKPANTGEQQPIAITSGLVKSLPAASNVVSATAGGAIGSVAAASNIISAAAGRLTGSPPASSNIVSLQKNTQLNAIIQPDIAAPETSHATPAESPAPSPSLAKAEVTEPARKQQAAMPDETPLWQLLQNEQYDALQAGIERMRASHGKWQPPQELLSLLQQGRLRQKIEQAIHSKDSAALIQLAELHPEDFACAHVDWAWALAEAQVALKQTDAAHLILQRLIPYCGEQDRLATLYKAKLWLDTPMWEALLEREAQAIRSDEGEAKFRRLRYDHGMEKLLEAHQAQNQPAFRALLQQLGGDIEHYRDADTALLSGWHYFNAQETTIADIWFGKALAWNPEQHDARSGLALSALQGKRFADAKRLADALPADSKGRQELLNTVAAAMAPGPRVLALAGAESNPGNSATYAGVILPIHSSLGGLGNGMVMRFWVDRISYNYNDSRSGSIHVYDPLIGNPQDHIQWTYSPHLKVEQSGIEGSLGYQKSGRWGSWAAFAGTVYRDLQRSGVGDAQLTVHRDDVSTTPITHGPATDLLSGNWSYTLYDGTQIDTTNNNAHVTLNDGSQIDLDLTSLGIDLIKHPTLNVWNQISSLSGAPELLQPFTLENQRVRGRVQLEGERILSDKWRVNINSSYVTGQGNYYVRGRLLHNLNERMLTGPEVITLGDPRFQIMQYGWVMTGLRVLAGMDVTLRTGARKPQGTDATIYLGLELARPF